jgi:uncharacterized protein
MLYHVAGLLREPVGSTRRFPIDPEAPVLRGGIELMRVPRGVMVSVDADVIIDDTCSRCLSPFDYRAQVRFEEVYAQQVDLLTNERVVPDDPDAFRIGLDHTIDITEAVRQYTVMAAAMQPLCRVDCPGLCPVCGTDLSLAACTCDRNPMDERWAVLATLRKNANG